MSADTRVRSTAQQRREQVLTAGLDVFARSGYQATPVSDVAAAAAISQGYVLRLFGTKLALFVAVLDDCYRRIRATLQDAAGAGRSPDQVLTAMEHAYAELIGDRSLLMLQVHAQSAADVPEIREAMQRGLCSIVEVVREHSGASDERVQRFVAFGQLCHLIVTADLEAVEQDWSHVLTNGMYEAPRATERTRW